MERSARIFEELGLERHLTGSFSDHWISTRGSELVRHSPVDLSEIAKVEMTSEADYEQILSSSQRDFASWRALPAPKRGELIREIGVELRRFKQPLGELITLETGKILSEGLGEVQEAIDICDFALGLSRQLYGLTMHSERPEHRMYEQWHPLGPIGVITAFNFPVAVWAWNAMIAAVCGDTVIWKPSELTPVSAIAVQKIVSQVASRYGFPALFSLMVGSGDLGKRLAADRRVPLISATGSTKMGREVGQTVAARFGKVLLELGGNSAVIVLDDADLNLAVPAVIFGAAGTAGQRCTTTRRVLVHRKLMPEFSSRLVEGYKRLKIGNPFDPKTLVGPLINHSAVECYRRAIDTIKREGGELLVGARVLEAMASPFYVEPTIVKAAADMAIVHEETFAPIVYLIEVSDLDQAISINNDVPQGLSSAIFTESIRAAERFLAAAGSDCGIANVNIGTSGAEIGGAFGGEKETGGGRESGSDSWRQYMRRQTNTINWGRALPLAQGVKFDVG